MTERAPPARTTLTHAHESLPPICKACFAEGRLAGLREAVTFLENEAHEYALIGLKEEMLAIDKCANALRWQAEDALKAPKTPEIPAGKQG